MTKFTNFMQGRYTSNKTKKVQLNIDHINLFKYFTSRRVSILQLRDDQLITDPRLLQWHRFIIILKIALT